MMTKRTTVFIVDDDQAAREAVAAVVNSMGVRAVTFDSAESFLTAYDPDVPGCLVSDVRMLELGGLELLERVRSSGSLLPVILITAYADVPLAVRAMQMGAATLLEKPCRSNDLWEAIQACIETNTASRHKVDSHRTVVRRLASLTSVERQIMELVVAGKPNKSIARELDLSLRTIESRRSNIFRKLAVDSVAELVRVVLQAEANAPGRF